MSDRCFPGWQERHSRTDLGPGLGGTEQAPPVRQLSRPYNHPDAQTHGQYNIGLDVKKFRMAGGTHFARAVQITPTGYYDRICVTFLNDNPILAGSNDFLIGLHFGLVNPEEGIFTPVLTGGQTDNAQFQVSFLGHKSVIHGITALGADQLEEDVPRTNAPFVVWLITSGTAPDAQATNVVVTLMSKDY